MKRNDRGFYENTIYVFEDTGGTVTYVGSSGNYHRRMINHKSVGTIHPNEVGTNITETNETLTKEEGAAWSEARENHYIEIYADTIRNKIPATVCVHRRTVHTDSE